MTVKPVVLPKRIAGPNRSLALVGREDRPLVDRVMRVDIYLRQSTTAYARVKAAFALRTPAGAAALAEFRLEMN